MDASGNIYLYISGSGIEESISFDKLIDTFISKDDYSPQLIGKFTLFASSATIEVWDIIDGANISLLLNDINCYEIGNTGRFGWSTENLPTSHKNIGHFLFKMTADTLETFDGEFFIKSQNNAQWIYPNDVDEYVMEI